MTKCKGCGVELQYTDSQKLGYAPKTDASYCQRCFRLNHYGDLQINMKQGIDSDVVLSQIVTKDALFLWVVDIFDLEASFIKALNRQLFQKDIVLVVTKCDLLPKSLGFEKISKFVYSRLKEYEINVKEILLTGLNFDTEEIFAAIEDYYQNRPVIVLGMANVGKSTFINNLMHKNDLTASKYPGTTLDLNELKIGQYDFIDTPGLYCEDTLLLYVKEEYLKMMLPNKRVKPKIFQLKNSQSLAIAGLIRLDFIDCKKVSVVFYANNLLDIHRCKVDNADNYWESHYEELEPKLEIPLKDFKASTIISHLDRYDIVINGLGWVSVRGDLAKIVAYHHPKTEIKVRKAMM